MRSAPDLQRSDAPGVPTPDAGAGLLRDVAELVPHRRCITGAGLRRTLDWIGDRIPLERTEVPSGERVGDWTIPDEWTVRQAYVELPDGSRLVDWADSALHLVQYSRPVDAEMTLGELRGHLWTRADRPDATPYRTGYYADDWGFCLPHERLELARAAFGDDARVRVRIDATLAPGALSYGECVIPGASPAEILLSAHVCHPHLANDNAAAVAVATELARRLLDGPRRRHTVRLVFAPGTIGALAWMARAPSVLPRIAGGLVLATLGDGGGLVYKRSRDGSYRMGQGRPPLAIDRAAALALRDLGADHELRPFSPEGYDERQYGSAGARLPVGRLSRTPHGEYPEYHTSDDDLGLIRPDALAGSLDAVQAVLDTLDADGVFQTCVPFGEPMLGRRGLYAHGDGTPSSPDEHRALLWALSAADGEHSLADAAELSGCSVPALRAAADRAVAAGAIREVTDA